MPVPSRTEIAAARLSSPVPRLDPRCRQSARGGQTGALGQGARAAQRFVSVAEIEAGGVRFGGPQLALIAGPCVIESDQSALRHAERLARISRDTGVPIIF